MESYNNCSTPTCNPMPTVKKEENVKMLLEDLNGILQEIYHQLDLIDDAIHGNKLDSTTSDSNNIVSSTLPMLADIREKKFLAEKILKITIHIKEGLW